MAVSYYSGAVQGWQPGVFSGIFGGGFATTLDGSASSGIRRLQLYELQEAELVKDAAKKAARKVVENEGRANPPAPRRLPKVVATKRKKPASAKTPSRSLDSYRFPVTVPLAPVKTLPTSYELLRALPPFVFEQITWTTRQETVIINLDVARKKRRRRTAALLLLMAA